MKTSQKHLGTSGIHALYHQHVQDIDPYFVSKFQIIENDDMCTDTNGQEKNIVSFDAPASKFFTLDSSPATTELQSQSSSAVSILSNLHHSPDICSASPASGLSPYSDETTDFKHKLKEIEISLLGTESDIVDSYYCCHKSDTRRGTARWQTAETLRKLDLKQVLTACAYAVSEPDLPKAVELMDVLEDMVSVSGSPIQRLGAYLLEGLRARLEKSGTAIYKALKCNEPTSSELMSYMSVLFQICPYWKFAYTSANAVIKEAVENNRRIHIIDFQITQGSQWMTLIEDLARRPGGPPVLRVTGVDDAQSFYARGGGLEKVGKRLSDHAERLNVPFEFNSAAICGTEVELVNLAIRPGESIVVNFPYILHHMPDESVSTENHRDRLLRLVKSLSPKVVTVVEQESNTNTSPFYSRFVETMEYYTAMFESIEAARGKDEKQRISAEQHCVARDIVNMIACEGVDRVERHEPFGKWRSRLSMAGFTQCQLSSTVSFEVNKMMRGFDSGYRVAENGGALFLGWKNRAMSSASAWR